MPMYLLDPGGSMFYYSTSFYNEVNNIMSNKIVIEYTRRAAALGGYYLRARVDPATVPDTLEECLVYSRAGGDRLIETATLAEMTSIAEETVLDYAYLKSSVVATPAVIDPNDLVTVTSAPSLWNEIGYAVPKTYRIQERVNTGGVWYLRIVPNGTYPDYFPAYAANVEFTITHAGGTDSGTDGTILRRPDNEGDSLYRVNDHYTLYDTVSDANSFLTQVEAGAQVLIDEYNESTWPSETFEETYE